MSMDNVAASGYTLPASKLTSLLPENVRKEYSDAIENNDMEAALDIFYENLPPKFPTYVDFFMLGDEDSSGDLETGVIYVEFQAEDLFVQTPKPELTFLHDNDLKPEFSRWTIWG